MDYRNHTDSELSRMLESYMNAATDIRTPSTLAMLRTATADIIREQQRRIS